MSQLINYHLVSLIVISSIFLSFYVERFLGKKENLNWLWQESLLFFYFLFQTLMNVLTLLFVKMEDFAWTHRDRINANVLRDGLVQTVKLVSIILIRMYNRNYHKNEHFTLPEEHHMYQYLILMFPLLNLRHSIKCLNVEDLFTPIELKYC